MEHYSIKACETKSSTTSGIQNLTCVAVSDIQPVGQEPCEGKWLDGPNVVLQWSQAYTGSDFTRISCTLHMAVIHR